MKPSELRLLWVPTISWSCPKMHQQMRSRKSIGSYRWWYIRTSAAILMQMTPFRLLVKQQKIFRYWFCYPQASNASFIGSTALIPRLGKISCENFHVYAISRAHRRLIWSVCITWDNCHRLKAWVNLDSIEALNSFFGMKKSLASR